MTNWLVGGVAADQPRREIAGLLQCGERFAGSRTGEPPMQVQFVFWRIAAVEPCAAALDDNSCWAKQVFEDCARLAGMLVAFDAKCQTFDYVLLACVILVAEDRDGRTEDHGRRVLRRPSGVVLGYVDEKSQSARKLCGT